MNCWNARIVYLDCSPTTGQRKSQVRYPTPKPVRPAPVTPVTTAQGRSFTHPLNHIMKSSVYIGTTSENARPVQVEQLSFLPDSRPIAHYCQTETGFTAELYGGWWIGHGKTKAAALKAALKAREAETGRWLRMQP